LHVLTSKIGGWPVERLMEMPMIGNMDAGLSLALSPAPKTNGYYEKRR
jgi:hypothetical protein